MTSACVIISELGYQQGHLWFFFDELCFSTRIVNVDTNANKMDKYDEQTKRIHCSLTKNEGIVYPGTEDVDIVYQFGKDSGTSKATEFSGKNGRLKMDENGAKTIKNVVNLPTVSELPEITVSETAENDSTLNTPNGKRASFGANNKKVTFDFCDVDENSNYDPPVATNSAESDDVTSHDDDADSNPTTSNDTLFFHNGDQHAADKGTLQKASSESHLDESTSSSSKTIRPHRISEPSFSNAQKEPSSLVRSSSDQVISTLSPTTLNSLEISRKQKKRRSVIKRKILKIHKAITKKNKTPRPEESEETRGDYKIGSDDSDEVSNRSEKDEIDGVSNGEHINGNREASSDTGLKLPNLQRNRIKHSYSVPGSRTDSRNSAYGPSSGSSIDLDSPGFNSETSRGSIPRLKGNSTSPAALNTISGTEGDVSDPNSLSPRLTPTHSNFGDSQLIGPSMGVSYHPHTHTLQIQNDSMRKSPRSSLSRQGSSRKKKRSGSWYNVLSPSYKQKNEDFHKFFKDLPSAERLLVDYNCALMKDIIIQGRLYVSQNYLCFHSNILKWQTAVVVKLVDIDQMTKEKTVKVIPNAIQCLMKDKTKMTFTSFTARDRAYLTTFRLWQNALLDKPMSASDLWSQIHRNYGEELGLCSSDDDYVRPEYIPRKHQPLGDAEADMRYEFGTTNKIKQKKKSSNSTQTNDDEFDKVQKTGSKSNKSSSQDSCNQSTGDEEKSMQSSQGSLDDVSLGDELQEDDDIDETEHLVDQDVTEEDGRETMKSTEDVKESRKSSKTPEAGDQEIESDDEPADYTLPDCAKISLCRKYDTSARDLFRIIFGDCSECMFWKDTLVNKGTTDIDFGTWADDSRVEGQRIRDLSYTLRLDNPIGPKTSHCKETQILYPSTVIGKSYGVDCIVQNYGIPYADYFQTCMRYCIRKVARDACELRITSELRYKKTPWGLIKNFIEKNVTSGLNQNFKKLEHQLQERIDLEKTQPQPMVNGQHGTSSNIRRRKRGSESTPGESPTHKNRSITPSRSRSSSSRRRRSKGSRSDLNNNKGGLTPTDHTAPGVPPPLTPNGYIPNSIKHHEIESPKMHYFGNGAKFIIGAILFIFILLIYSNYSMYQRLTTLEQVATAAATADGINPSVTAAILGRPGVSITDNPEILSTYLQAIDKRLHKLEEMMIDFAETSEGKWNKMENDWKTLQNMIRTIIQQKAASGGQ